MHYGSLKNIEPNEKERNTVLHFKLAPSCPIHHSTKKDSAVSTAEDSVRLQHNAHQEPQTPTPARHVQQTCRKRKKASSFPYLWAG